MSNHAILRTGGPLLVVGLLLACSSSEKGSLSTGGSSGGQRSEAVSVGAGSTGILGGSSLGAGGRSSAGGLSSGGVPVGGKTGGTSLSSLRTGGTSALGGSMSSITGGTRVTTGTGGASTAAGGGTGVASTGGSSPGNGGTTDGASSGSGQRDGGAPSDAGNADVMTNAAVDGSGASRSKGCGLAFTRPDPAAQQSLSVSGSGRTYQIYVPTGYSSETALPLIFALHGGGGNAAGARNDFKLEAVVGNNAIVVYPDNMTNYATGTDMAFFDALLEATAGKYCIDTHRVFATGFSMGGIFVNGIGCLRGGSTVRGIIPVAGSGPNPNLGPASEADIACPSGTPTGDVAVMIIHGTADTNALFKYAQWEANYWALL